MTYSKVAIIEQVPMEAQGGSGVIGLLCSTSSLEGVDDQRHVPAALPPRKNSGTNFRGGGVCPRASFDRYGEEKISLRTPDRPSHSESLYWVARKKKFEKH